MQLIKKSALFALVLSSALICENDIAVFPNKKLYLVFVTCQYSC